MSLRLTEAVHAEAGSMSSVESPRDKARRSIEAALLGTASVPEHQVVHVEAGSTSEDQKKVQDAEEEQSHDDIEPSQPEEAETSQCSPDADLTENSQQLLAELDEEHGAGSESHV